MGALMSGAIYYPKADRKTQWFADTYPGTEMSRISKLLLHSTETASWPSYDRGAVAPTLTYHPKLRQWRQHFPLNRSARALKDAAGTVVRENRGQVVQVEIIGTCDPARHKTSPSIPYMPELPVVVLGDLAELLVFLNREWSVPLHAAPVWLPYPESYGNTKARMSGETYDKFEGVLGHQHASGNDHGDPGKIDAGTIVSMAEALIKPPKPDPLPSPPIEDGDEMELISYKGVTYLRWGLYRRVVPDESKTYATRLYGKIREVALWEMALYTPLDTALKIEADDRTDSGAAAKAIKVVAEQVARMEKMVETVLQQRPS